MRRKILPFILGCALAIAAVGPAAAAPTNVNFQRALLGVTVQAIVQNVDVLNNSANDLIDVNISDSLNNLLQNALQNADIDILNDLEVRIFNILNDLNVNVQDVEIDVLTGDITITLLDGSVDVIQF